MREQKKDVFTAPIFLSAAFFVFALAIVEKGLNVFGWSIPFTTVYPNQLLNWAVTLLIFEIALTLRQLADYWFRAGAPREPASAEGSTARGQH